MIGAGLFLNIAPTAKIASYSLILGLIMASSVAFANASSSAQLARLYPQTGGTYLYAKNVLGKIPSLIAGYSFIIGKSISCVAIALTLGNYISPMYPEYSGILVIIIVTSISYFGIVKTDPVAIVEATTIRKEKSENLLTSKATFKGVKEFSIISGLIIPNVAQDTLR